jgi:hypothetical protein
MTRSITADVSLDCRHDVPESLPGDADHRLLRWVETPAGGLRYPTLASREERRLRWPLGQFGRSS